MLGMASLTQEPCHAANSHLLLAAASPVSIKNPSHVLSWFLLCRLTTLGWLAATGAYRKQWRASTRLLLVLSPSKQPIHVHCCCVQVDYFGVAGGNRGLPEAAERLNKAAAWMYVQRPAEAPSQGLGNCVWLLDDAAAAGGLACVHHGQQRMDSLLGLAAAGSTDGTSSTGNASSGSTSGTAASNPVSRLMYGRRLAAADAATAATAADAVTATTASSSSGRSSRWVLLPANAKLQLQLFEGGKVKRQVIGTPGRLSWVDVGSSADALQVLWPSK